MTPDNIDNIIDLISANGFWIIGAIIVLGCVGFSCVKDMAISRSRERTRREVAAYVAEGSMTPEHAERLLIAGVEDL